MKLYPGAILDERYKIIEELGYGGYGKTYLALDKRLQNRQVAIKELRPLNTDEDYLKDARERFYQEANTLLKLNEYPNIPDVYDFLEKDSEFYLVQEFIDGQDFNEFLINSPIKSEDEIINCLSQTLNILDCIHQINIIHRDIKPSNLMVRSSDQKIYLIDFGAIKEITVLNKDSKGIIKPTIPIGTEGYIAPEQWNGNPKFCSDIYSLGIVIIQAITGLSPQEINGLISQSATTKYKGLSSILKDSGFSSNLTDILLKMVAYYHEERFQSAKEVLDDLQELPKSKRISTWKSKILKRISTWKSKIFKKWYLIGLFMLPIAIASLIVFNSPNTQNNNQTGLNIQDNHNQHFFQKPTKVPVNTRVRIAGSISMIYHNHLYKQKFEKQYRATVDTSSYENFNSRGSEYGVYELCNGEIDLAAVSLRKEFVYKECPEKTKSFGQKLFVHEVAPDALSFFVHKNNPVNNLTSSQIKDIFKCKLSDWNDPKLDLIRFELKPSNISVLGSPKQTGGYNYLKTAILGGEEPCLKGSPNYQNYREKSEDEIQKTIQEFKENEISYTGYYLTNQSKIKQISINGILPDPENKQYPFFRMLSYVYLADSEENPSEAVKLFLGFVDNTPLKKEDLKNFATTSP
ncbi:serine/threonine-protein kinase [Nostoc commune]|uniref:serine/threonine-protein kinase n=1 Tax=Nostoc commune TaxID=1178 RepID=UPI0018C6767D|nr:serine/threonine-protein kinase [Nostoc commune]MBG1259903.1 protein kinase [Nostoc commune BAE]